MRKTTEQRYEKWREMVASGLTISDVAKYHHVSWRTVNCAMTTEARVRNAIVLLRRGRDHKSIQRASDLPLHEISRLAGQDLDLLSSDDEALRTYAETITMEAGEDRRGGARFFRRREESPAQMWRNRENSARAYLISRNRRRGNNS